MLVGCLEFGEKGKNGSDSIDGGEGLKEEQVFCQEKRQFAGHEFDEDVQLYYCRARFMDPTLGAFISEDPVKDGVNWYVYASNNPLNRVDPTGMVDVFYDGSVGFDPDDSNIYFIPHYNQYKDSSWTDDIGSKVLLLESDNMDYSVALSMAGFDVSKIDEKAISAAKKLIESKGYTWKDGKYEKNGILGKLFNKAFLGEAAGHDKTDSLFMDVMLDVYELISEVKNTPENREQAAGSFTQYAVTASLFSFYSQSGSNTQNQKPVQTRPFRGDAGSALHRPYIRNGTRTTIENNALKIGDNFIDPNTGKVIEGSYNLGHKYGHEFYKYKSWAESQGMTQQQFNNLMNNPNLYQIEDALSNMSHAFEAPADIFLGGN